MALLALINITDGEYVKGLIIVAAWATINFLFWSVVEVERVKTSSTGAG